MDQQAEQQSAIHFDLQAFCSELIPPQPFVFGKLLEAVTSKHQVAGHSPFLTSGPGHCLKPFNIKCARGRREHLFYQLVNYYCTRKTSETLYYKNFPLFIHPEKQCDCAIDAETFRTIKLFLAEFAHVKHLSLDNDDFLCNKTKLQAFFESIYSDNVRCPCYETDKWKKEMCSANYEQENYLCLEDLHAHCREPCILDIKIGRVTHDPMATQQKIEEQTNKYPRLSDFGFRILGMKTNLETKAKEFGRSLESQDQVFDAIEGFFAPLQTSERKAAVVGRMLDHLERLLEWFETKNNHQLKFFSSSLLFVYDSKIVDETPIETLIKSVRVKMIDFAHVFHSHDRPEIPGRSGSSTSIFTSGKLNKDDNYLFGLRRLVKFFIMLNRQYRVQMHRK